MDLAVLGLAVLSILCIATGLYLILHGRKRRKKIKAKPIANVKDEKSTRSLIAIAEKLKET
jgi:hypothetical protein